MARNLSSKTRNRTSKATARLVHSRATQATGSRTPYRRAMDALAAEVNRSPKTATPERRKKLHEAKDELRRLSGVEPTQPKGKGGPGKRYYKQKAKSRRNPTQEHGAPNKPLR